MPVSPEYALSSAQDSPFYSAAADEGRPERALRPARALPGWTRARWGGWESWSPPGWRPRVQGWKIHLSSTREHFQTCLDRTAEVCARHTASFKFLCTARGAAEANAKHTPRPAAGKFITVYPDSDAHFSLLVRELEDAVGDLPGPYVLSDVRHGRTPVFFRYGAFVPLSHRSGTDEAVPCIVDPDGGQLVPDVRSVPFSCPPGADGDGAPPEVRAAVERFRAAAPTELDAFESIVPLKHSNAGGVYRAVRRGSPLPRVLREARPLAGTDARERDAVARLRHEATVLAELQGSPHVQELFGSFTAWEHHYLELGHVEGTTLAAWGVRNFPFHGGAGPDREYAARCRRLVTLLERAVDDVHGRGWCVGDLHPGNLLVGPDEERLVVIDLEDATRVGAPREIAFRVLEFSAPADRTGVEADWYAAARAALSLYAVDWAIAVLAPGYWAECLARVERRFGRASAEQVERLAARSGPPPGAAGSLPHALTPSVTPRPVRAGEAGPGQLGSDLDVARRLAAGVLASRRYGRRGIFPGDPGQGTGPGRYAVDTGQAGVVLALHRLGCPVPGEDRERLLRVAETWTPAQGAGLYTGAAGIAVALHELGDGEPARQLVADALRSAQAANRCDLFGGLAGVALAALQIGREAGDAALVDAATDAARELDERLAAPEAGPGAGFFSAPLVRRPGLYFGWCGPALLDLARFALHGDAESLERAHRRVRADVEGCVTDAHGALAVLDRDGNRTLPYLGWGSAGILSVAGLAGRVGGGAVLPDERTAGLVRACTATSYVYPSLNRGLAGVIAGLSWDPDRDGVGGRLAPQVTRLRESLLMLDGAPHTIGENLVRLSSDHGTGAAGVALVLAGYRSGSLLHLPVPGLDRWLPRPGADRHGAAPRTDPDPVALVVQGAAGPGFAVPRPDRRR